MKLSIATAALLLATGFVTASTEQANAVVYCTYVGYPAGCVARAGVVLRPRPVARAVCARGRTAWDADEPRRSGRSGRQARLGLGFGKTKARRLRRAPFHVKPDRLSGSANLR